jgi:hypothetical protein
MYGEIMNIMEDELRHNVFLTSTFHNRSLTLNHLAQRFSMQPLFPQLGSIASPDGRACLIEKLVSKQHLSGTTIPFIAWKALPFMVYCAAVYATPLP